jgi:DnaJ-class molecular chaperone
MEQRMFYVALGVPRGAEPEAVLVAYRKLVTRYRCILESEDFFLDEPTQPPLTFGVLRSYSERRHGAIFDEPEPLVTKRRTEVDRFFGGVVPEVLDAPLARREGKDLLVEIRLTPEEAQRGGIFPVHIPVVSACPRCQEDRDAEGGLACRVCGGKRSITIDRMVEITAPPGIREGRVVRVAMEDVGLDETDLIVAVVVG